VTFWFWIGTYLAIASCVTFGFREFLRGRQILPIDENFLNDPSGGFFKEI